MAGFQRLNSNTYALSVTSTSGAITLTNADAQSNTMSRWIVYNDGDVSVFVVSGLSSAPTAVFPTSATVPVAGKVIGPGVTVSFDRDKDHKYLAAITASGTASIYVSAGPNG